jgi:TonB family protein
LLAFRDSFSSAAENRPAARLGADARVSNEGAAAIGRPERSMVASQAPGSSGGINVASLSRDVGGGDGGGGGAQMAGVQTSRVESSIGPGGGSGRPLAGGGGNGSGALAGRTDEEIQIVFDRYKSSLYRLYNRELRRDPTLRGQMVLKLTIEPNGSVSMCVLQSSDMNAPELAQQVVERVRTFDFGAKDVAAVTIVYPIDFLPAL